MTSPVGNKSKFFGCLFNESRQSVGYSSPEVQSISWSRDSVYFEVANPPNDSNNDNDTSGENNNAFVISPDHISPLSGRTILQKHL